MKQVLIYGTLGPACSDPEILKQMLNEGMDGMRLNLSHAALEESEDLLDAYHRAAQACGKRPLLLIDLQGPELRIGRLSAPIRLNVGERIAQVCIPFPDEVFSALDAAPVGQEILLDDGKILLTKADRNGLSVARGGLFRSFHASSSLIISVDTLNFCSSFFLLIVSSTLSQSPSKVHKLVTCQDSPLYTTERASSGSFKSKLILFSPSNM